MRNKNARTPLRPFASNDVKCAWVQDELLMLYSEKRRENAYSDVKMR
jgi:hypothetical protein